MVYYLLENGGRRNDQYRAAVGSVSETVAFHFLENGWYNEGDRLDGFAEPLVEHENLSQEAVEKAPKRKWKSKVYTISSARIPPLSSLYNEYRN